MLQMQESYIEPDDYLSKLFWLLLVGSIGL